MTQDIQFIWIGGGSDNEENALKDAGVLVTGILNFNQVGSVLNQCDLYIHTAAWEGNSLAVLEASSVNLPILARSIGAIDSIPDFVSSQNVKVMVSDIQQFIAGSKTKALANMNAVKIINSKSKQVRALSLLYRR